MKSKRPLRPEEKQIWRKIAKSVRPLDDARVKALDEDKHVQPAPAAPKSATSRQQKRTKDRPSHHPHHPPPKHHHIPVPVDRSAEKRVRRGKLEIDARIDLHGLTQDQALSALTHFLRMAYGEGYRNVLVITGKGLKQRARESEPWDYPEEPGVLRRKLPEWLGNPTMRQWVSGYSTSHVRHGGSGAFYVTLRTRRL